MRRHLVVVIVLLTVSAALQAVVATRATVGTTATVIYTAPQGGANIFLRNAGAASLFLGGSTVTTANGFEVPATTTIGPIPVRSGDIVYGIVASGTNAVHVLEPRR